jgi:hypothetical protein
MSQAGTGTVRITAGSFYQRRSTWAVCPKYSDMRDQTSHKCGLIGPRRSSRLRDPEPAGYTRDGSRLLEASVGTGRRSFRLAYASCLAAKELAAVADDKQRHHTDVGLSFDLFRRRAVWTTTRSAHDTRIGTPTPRRRCSPGLCAIVFGSLRWASACFNSTRCDRIELGPEERAQFGCRSC